MNKKIMKEISDHIIEEQEFKICYQIDSITEAKKLNNITYNKIKKNWILYILNLYKIPHII